MALETGTRFGPFEVVEQIGSGGMGEVWRATDTSLKRDVAVKALPESFAADADRVARFQREAEILASLNHPNIATIHGLEKAESQTVIVMELVEGPTLADRIAEGPLPPDEALSIARQVADALEAAHDGGIVHRDLKPANIKLKDDGTIKVLDFGIAKAFEPLGTTSGGSSPVMTTPVTHTGIILGTAAYMSPEQARGKPIDKRTDIWAFGCVLYEMLTGQPAFGGEDVAVTLARIIANDSDMDSLPAAISPAVRQTLRLCLKKDMRERVRDIGDVKLALAGEFESWPGDAPAPEPRTFLQRFGLGAAGLVVGLLIAGVSVFSLTRPGPAPPVSRFLITPPPTAPLANVAGYDVAISSDGRRIAYVGNPEPGSVALYVRDLDALEARLLPGTGASGANPNMFFSADGTWIGFTLPGQGILRAAVGGGPPLKINDSPGANVGATAAGDGTVIYSSGDGLYRVSAGGGGTAERLTPESEGAITYIAPALLPGGRALIYSVLQGSDEHIGLLDLQTGEQKILVENGVQNPRYAATGHIVFARGTTLMAVPFDLERLEVTGEPVALLEGVRRPAEFTAADFALSDTGTLVYVPGGSVEAPISEELVWVDRDGRISDPVLSAARPRDPRLSPDGRRLLLTTGTANNGDVWIYDFGGRPPIPIAADDGDTRLAVWSPDGREVAFSSIRGGNYEVYIVPADGSMLDPQPVHSAVDYPIAPAAWSDNGELILYRATGGPGGGDILTTRAEPDAEIRDVIVTADSEYDAAPSPDGRWLAYASTRTGQPEIWVKPYPDGAPVRVSRDGGVEPRWASDGQELYYLQGNSVMAVGIEADTEFSFDAAIALFDVAHLNAPAGDVHSYDVAADGRFLMIRSPSGTTEAGASTSIVVVENWFEELKRRVPTD
jgi:Tol biopolymer transport system component